MQSNGSQEVYSWGFVGVSNSGCSTVPIHSQALSKLDVKEISCGERSFVLLTHDGKVYSHLYNAEKQVIFPFHKYTCILFFLM